MMPEDDLSREAEAAFQAVLKAQAAVKEAEARLVAARKRHAEAESEALKACLQGRETE
jgi:hypothetical protein